MQTVPERPTTSAHPGLTLALLLASLAAPAMAQDSGAASTPTPPEAADAPPAVDDAAPAIDVPASPMRIEAFDESPLPDVSPPAESQAASAPPAMPVDAFDERPAGPEARVYGWLGSRLGIDTRFDSPPGAPMAEDVAEGRLRAVLGVDVKLTPRLRVVLEGRAQLWSATQRGFERARGFFEPTLGDAFIDLYTPKVDLRVGLQRITLGANAGLAPADALNPRDLRDDPLLEAPEAQVLPVFAIRAQGEVGRVSWLAAYAPFFTPDTWAVFGRDRALLQPGLGLGVEDERVDASIVELLQPRLLETRRPVPFDGDVALRLSRAGRVTLGASWVWMHEKLPRVTLDPELATALALRGAGRPVPTALATSLASRLDAGETLFTAEYHRAHLVSVEASTLLGEGQLDADLTFTPERTFVDAALRPLGKPALSWVLGYSQASDSPWLYAVSYLGMAAFDVGAKEQLFILEPATAVGAPRTAFFHAFVGTLGYRFLDERLEVSARLALDAVQWSLAVAPSLSWSFDSGVRLDAQATVSHGDAWSPFGYFQRNDAVWLGVRYDWR